MVTATTVVDRAKELSAAGQHAEVVAMLCTREQDEVADSPFLALLYGTALAQLGRPAEGLAWVERALSEARRYGDRVLEKRALIVRGGISLVSGQVDEAADFYTQALLAASQDGDAFNIGRACNNLGIISNLRGRQAEALGSYEMAVVAFERAGLHRGMAQCRHNLAITCREQGEFARALAEADRAIEIAKAVGDKGLTGMALRGRAEIHLAMGDLPAARREIERSLTDQQRLGDPVEEAESLRISGQVAAAEGRLDEAERIYRDVVERARQHDRPLLTAEAQADLARLLRRIGRVDEAREAARAAQVIFNRLGAEAELRKLANDAWEAAFADELHRTLEPLHEAQVLADRGRYAELLAYLEARPSDELAHSATLAVLRGIAHARLGQLELGQQWAMVALSRARLVGDRPLELRALNVCGAIALERGGIHEATHFFARAQEQALRDSDPITVGRCANNLGVIANMQGDHGRAVGAYTRALAAYQQARFAPGLAESQHNLAITYREMGSLDLALQTAGTAVQEADRLGDRRLKAQALAGRAEIRIARGEPELARREVERALVMHRELQDPVLETEDLRILAVALGTLGQAEEAETMLRGVIARAGEHIRPELAAVAQRDLAVLLAEQGRGAEARALVEAARMAFIRLRADHELRKADAILASLSAVAV